MIRSAPVCSPALVLALVLVPAAGTQAQLPDEARPHEHHRALVLAGQYYDVETASVLSRAKVGALEADLRVFTDRRGLVVQPLAGTRWDVEPAPDPALLQQATERPNTEELPVLGWRRGVDGPLPAAFVFTSTGTEALVAVADGYCGEGPYLVLEQWTATPGSGPARFAAPPALDVRYVGPHFRAMLAPRTALRWRAPGAEWESLLAEQGGRHDFGFFPPDSLVEVEAWSFDESGRATSRRRASTLRAGPTEVRRTQAILHQWTRGSACSVDLRTAEVREEGGDLHPAVYSLQGEQGSLVRRLGAGRELFESIREVDPWGFAPFSENLREDHVYKVLRADGRVAVVWLDSPGDFRDELHVHARVLESGGWTFPDPLEGLEASTEGGRLSLSWKAHRQARRYEIFHDGPEGWEQIGEVERPGFRWIEAPPLRLHRLAVQARTVDGGACDRARIEVPFFPKPWRYGRISLDAYGRTGFDLDAEQTLPENGVEEARIDLRITNSAGGSSSVQIEGAHGIAPADEATRLDRLSGEARLREQQSVLSERLERDIERRRTPRVDLDDRRPESEFFLVRTDRGGIATLHKVDSDFPTPSFVYAYLPPER